MAAWETQPMERTEWLVAAAVVAAVDAAAAVDPAAVVVAGFHAEE